MGKCNETKLPKLPKRVCKELEIKNLDEYHDLYLKSDILHLADIFQNFREMCYELHPVKLVWAPGLVWQTALKKTEVKLKSLTDIDMLLMVEKGIRDGICHTIHRYVKANNKYMKDYDKNQESSYHKYWNISNWYGWAMSQNLPVNNFEWIEDCEEEYFLEVDVQDPEKLHELHNYFFHHFYQKEWNLEK